MSDETVNTRQIDYSAEATNFLNTIQGIEINGATIDINSLPVITVPSTPEGYPQVAQSGEAIIYKTSFDKTCVKDYRFNRQGVSRRFNDQRGIDAEILSAVAGHLVANSMVETPKPLSLCIDPMTNRLVGFQMELIEGSLFSRRQVQKGQSSPDINQAYINKGLDADIKIDIEKLRNAGVVVDELKAIHDPQGDNIKIKVEWDEQDTIATMAPIYFDLSLSVKQYKSRQGLENQEKE